MRIVLFSHPHFLGSQSMPRFVNMLATGMTQRGWRVSILVPQPYFYKIPAPALIRKWLGYIDQYVLFPLRIMRRLKRYPSDTLFVIADHALGPYVPLIAHRPHVIHCHDFLAQRSALGMIPGNATGWTGRRYQAFIRRGYSRGRHFVSVSNKTQEDLHNLLEYVPVRSEVVYNGLNPVFRPQDVSRSRELISARVGINLDKGYVLHVGGNQWYKNRIGVIQIYNAWRTIQKNYLPLIMIGKTPDVKLRQVYEHSPFRDDIYMVVNPDDTLMPEAYSGALAFLFPSIAEGFGWPIAEAMACGCPVITTNAAPMREVAGDAGFYIPVKDPSAQNQNTWAQQAAATLDQVVNMKPFERARAIGEGLKNIERFDVEKALDRIDTIYRRVSGFERKMHESSSVV